MIFTKSDGNSTVRCDICIIGAGLAGIYAAVALRQRGFRVSIIEVGGVVAGLARREDVESQHEWYAGAVDGRALGLGGTSTRWGGQLCGMSAHELRKCILGQPSPWPIEFEDLSQYYPKVFERLGVPVASMPNNERDLSDPAWGFVGGSAFSLPSSKRNFSRLWAATLETDDGLAVFLDSTVQSVTLSGGNGARHVCELVTCLADKSSLTIRADAFLLCAGALASTCFYQQHLLSHLPDKQFAVGTNLQDHLSVEIARVQVREGFWERFGLRLQHRGILFPRLFMTSLLETEQQVPAGFLHFTYDSSSPLPSWLHDAQRNVQTGEWRQLARHAFRGLQHVGDLAQLAWTFCARERIEWPQSVPLKLTLDLEQYPDAQNKVESLGGRRMAIAWRRMDRDDLAANRIKEYVLSTWSDSPYAKLADLVPATDGQERVAYHPTGTLRMSDAPDWGAVDGNCRVHGLRNAYILSTATFPRCGAANPSLTLLALTERLTATLSPAT